MPLPSTTSNGKLQKESERSSAATSGSSLLGATDRHMNYSHDNNNSIPNGIRAAASLSLSADFDAAPSVGGGSNNNINFYNNNNNNNNNVDINYNNKASTELFCLQPRHPMPALRKDSAAPHYMGLQRGRKRGSSSLQHPQSFAAPPLEVQQPTPITRRTTTTPGLQEPKAAWLQHPRQPPPPPPRDYSQNTVPIKMVSFVPSPSNNQSSIRTRTTPTTIKEANNNSLVSNTTQSTIEGKDPFSTPYHVRNNSFQLRPLSVEMNTPGSTGDNVDGALHPSDASGGGDGESFDVATMMTFQGLALNSPRPSPGPSQFSHKEISSPFSVSSRQGHRVASCYATGAATHLTPSLASRTPTPTSAFGEGYTALGGASNYSLFSSATNGSRCSSMATTPPPPQRTAPLQIVTGSRRTTVRKLNLSHSLSTPPSAPRKRSPPEDPQFGVITSLKSPKNSLGQETPKAGQHIRNDSTDCTVDSDEGDEDDVMLPPPHSSEPSNYQVFFSSSSSSSPALHRTPLPSETLPSTNRNLMTYSNHAPRNLSDGEQVLRVPSGDTQRSSSPQCVAEMVDRLATTASSLSPIRTFAEPQSPNFLLPIRETSEREMTNSDSEDALDNNRPENMLGNSKTDGPLKQSDMSFIPLPEWQHHCEEQQHPLPSDMRRRRNRRHPESANQPSLRPQHPILSRKNSAAGAAVGAPLPVRSLLQPSSRSIPDPIDEIFGSTVSVLHTGGNHPQQGPQARRGSGGRGGVHHHDTTCDVESESLSDTASDWDCAFLLAAPKDIEERRLHQGTTAGGRCESERPAKAACRRTENLSRFHDSNNNNNNNSQQTNSNRGGFFSASYPGCRPFSLTTTTATINCTDDSAGEEQFDYVPRLPQLQSSTSTGTVATRDLITPPAMLHGTCSSPPPMLPSPCSPQFH